MAEPILRSGSSGEAVRELQVALNETGHDPGPIDGAFGAQTEAAVKAFQQDRGISVDGVVGLITWRNIDEFAEFDEPVLREGLYGATGAARAKSSYRRWIRYGWCGWTVGSQTESGGVRVFQQTRG